MAEALRSRVPAPVSVRVTPRRREARTTLASFLRRCPAAATTFLTAVQIACAEGTAPLVLDDLSTPDTNAVTVVFNAALTAGSVEIEGGREYRYDVRTDRTPHTLAAEHVVDGDTARVQIVLSELYDAGPVSTDGAGNAFAWIDYVGSVWRPVVPCTLDVTEAFVFGTPSLQAVETACRVRSPTGAVATVFVKARRWATLGG